MPRVSRGPSYEASKRRWVANLDGKKIPLLVNCDKTKDTEDEAWELYRQHRSLRMTETEGDTSEVWTVLNNYLVWLQTREDPAVGGTMGAKRRVIEPFIEMYGNIPTRDLRMKHFEDFLAKMKQPRPNKRGVVRAWGKGTCRLAMATFRAAFNWAQNTQGLITFNPLRMPGTKPVKVRVDYRGARTAITDEEHAALLKLALGKTNKDFACALMLLYETGARPGEILLARADEWNEEHSAFVIKADDDRNVGRFKNKRHGRDRIVYIPKHLVPAVRVLMEKHPTGTLFRSANNVEFTVRKADERIDSSIEALNKRAGTTVVRWNVSCYSYRHAFVTRWLKRGGSVQYLAVLLGTSITYLEKHYSHLFQEHDAINGALNAFAGEERRRAASGTAPATSRASTPRTSEASPQPASPAEQARQGAG